MLLLLLLLPWRCHACASPLCRVLLLLLLLLLLQDWQHWVRMPAWQVP
jgi:hypothetical protein